MPAHDQQSSLFLRTVDIFKFPLYLLWPCLFPFVYGWYLTVQSPSSLTTTCHISLLPTTALVSHLFLSNSKGLKGKMITACYAEMGQGKAKSSLGLYFFALIFFFNRELGYHKREVYCLLSHVLEAIFTSTPRFNHHYNNQLKILTQQKNKKLSPHSEYHGTTISTSLWRVWFHLALRKKVSTFN